MRQYKGSMAVLVKSVAIAAALYHIFFITGILDFLGVGLFLLSYRAGSLALVFLLIFLLYPPAKSLANDRLYWLDYIFILLGVAPCIYMMFFTEQILNMHASLEYTPNLIAVLMLLIAALEATRRIVGWAIVIIAALFFIFPMFQTYIPGILGGKSASLAAFCSYLFTNVESGIFGLAYGAASTIIIVFVIFSQFLLVSGAGQFFLNLALSLLGDVRGGPAKVAVVASALFGTVSGSTAANIAATGTVTIPLMKSIGYKPSFAGAVETVASNGGQIVPPVMGLVVFIMADITGIPYWQICIAAIIPAILYYVALFVQVDAQAVKSALKGVPREQLPSFRQTIKEGWFYLIPLIGLVVILIGLKYSPEISGLYSIVILILVSLFFKKARVGPRGIAKSLDEGVRSFLMPGIVCALVGVIMGAAIQTGLGVKLSGFLIDLSAGNVVVLLLLTAAACYFLGMGLGSIPLYIMMVALTAPALMDMKVGLEAAHFFVLWWGLTSFITPPVCIAVYVACSLSHSGIWETGWAAMRLGLGNYIVPFMFVFRPEILMMGSPGEIALSTMICIIAILALAYGTSGLIIAKLNWAERIVLICGSLILIIPNIVLNSVGIALIAIVTLLNVRKWFKLKREAVAI